MPKLTIGQQVVEVQRLTLDVPDVARILRMDAGEVRTLVKRGDLRDVASGRDMRLDPEQVARLVERLVDEYALPAAALAELAELVGRPRPPLTH